MAKRKRKYSRSAGSDVKSEMHRYKRGTAQSGKGGKGGKVKNRKQAIAIGLSKARKKGKKVPRKKSLPPAPHRFGCRWEKYTTMKKCPLARVVSTGRRNTCNKSFCWGFNSQGFTWPFVELTHHFV